MRIDPFMAMMGLGKVDGDVPAEVIASVCDEAEAYLRAGGVIEPSWWAQLNEVSRAALVKANELIWRERCAMIGQASQGPIEAAMILDEEEGKDALARKAVDFMVRKAKGKNESVAGSQAIEIPSPIS